MVWELFFVFLFFFNSTAQPSNTILLTELVQRCALFYLQGWVSVGGSGHARACLYATRVATLPGLIKNDSLFGATGSLYLDFYCGVWYGESVHATLRAPRLEDGSAVHECGRGVLHHASFHLCWRGKGKKISHLVIFEQWEISSHLAPIAFGN